jgi:hypothetical protein
MRKHKSEIKAGMILALPAIPGDMISAEVIIVCEVKGDFVYGYVPKTLRDDDDWDGLRECSDDEYEVLGEQYV